LRGRGRGGTTQNTAAAQELRQVSQCFW